MLLLGHVLWDVFLGACSCTSLVRHVFGLWHYLFFLLRLAPTQGRVCEEQKAKENRARLKAPAQSNRGTKQFCTLQPKDRFLHCSSNALQNIFSSSRTSRLSASGNVFYIPQTTCIKFQKLEDAGLKLGDEEENGSILKSILRPLVS